MKDLGGNRRPTCTNRFIIRRRQLDNDINYDVVAQVAKLSLETQLLVIFRAVPGFLPESISYHSYPKIDYNVFGYPYTAVL